MHSDQCSVYRKMPLLTAVILIRRAQLAPELMWGTAKLILDTVPGEDGEPRSRQATTRAVPDVLTSRLSSSSRSASQADLCAMIGRHNQEHAVSQSSTLNACRYEPPGLQQLPNERVNCLIDTEEIHEIFYHHICCMFTGFRRGQR
jgi:hypothetical protein